MHKMQKQSLNLQMQESEIVSHMETYLVNMSVIITFKRVSPIFHRP